MAQQPAQVQQSQSATGASKDTKLIITVLLLIFVYPVGLILMWVWTKWPIWVKVLITLPVILFIILIFLAVLLPVLVAGTSS